MKNFYKFSALCAVFILVPIVSFADFNVSLKHGSRGEAVSELQDFLIDQGFLTSKIDGKFGLGTLRAVKAWQSSVGLKADGYFGSGSRAKANTILADLLKDSDATEIAEEGNVKPLSTVGGCVSTSGYSTQTGAKCDGTVPTPTQVTDVTAQSKLDALTVQLQAQQNALNQIQQNTYQNSSTEIAVNKPIIKYFSSSKDSAEVGDVVTISYKAENVVVCTSSIEGANIQIPFVGTLPEFKETFTLSETSLKNGNFSYQLICANKDWTTVKQILNIPLADQREVVFNTLAFPKIAALNKDNVVFEVSNIHNNDIISLDFGEITISKTFTENVQGQDRGGNKTYGYFSKEFDYLTPNTEYPYTIRIQRANLSSTFTGTFKTLAQ